MGLHLVFQHQPTKFSLILLYLVGIEYMQMKYFAIKIITIFEVSNVNCCMCLHSQREHGDVIPYHEAISHNTL